MTDQTTEQPDSIFETQFFGDGVLTLPPIPTKKEGDSTMDPELMKLIMAETAGNIQANNRDGRNVGTIALGTLQGGMAKTFNELGPVESRAVSGVMATPIAGPTAKVG